MLMRLGGQHFARCLVYLHPFLVGTGMISVCLAFPHEFKRRSLMRTAAVTVVLLGDPPHDLSISAEPLSKKL